MGLKYALLVPDGAWDRPIASLGGQTPLSVANTPNMDRLASEGMLGMLKTVPDGFSPASDVANMSLLGYPPQMYYSGRAPLEAANIGVKISENQVAFRCNLVTVIDNVMVDYSAGHISTQEAEYLMDDLNKLFSDLPVTFYTGTSYRNLLVIEHNNPQNFLNIKCTPPHNIAGQKIDNFLPQGNCIEEVEFLRKLMFDSVETLSASDVNKVRLDLGENPATMIWLWGQGINVSMPSFKERFGISGAMISAVDLLKGLGNLIGLKVLEVPGATGYYDTNYKAKGEFAVNILSEVDFVMVHVEAPDEAGHNGDIEEKIRAIERFDAMIVGPIISAIERYGGRVLISPDHPTPIECRGHTADFVGFVLWGKDVFHNHRFNQYNEQTCEGTGLFVENGPELFATLLGKSKVL